MSDDYVPIDCSLHDRLEDFATRRQRVVIRYAGENGEVMLTQDVITDWFVHAGAEYLRTAGGREIRLDRLISVSDHPFT